MNLATLKVSIGADLSGLEKGLAQASRSLTSFGKNMTATGALMSKAFTLPIKGALAVSVMAFGKQEDAERKLASAIASTGGNVEANMKRFKAFASEMQSVTRVGDETALAILQVATSMGLNAEQAERATRNAIAMESAFGVSAQSAIRMTSALEQGDATMLRRYIPSLRGVTDETQMLTKAHDILANAFATAEADAQTFTGQLAQLRNSFGDFMEQVGEVVAEALVPFIARLKEIVEELKKTDKEVIKFYVGIGALVAVIGPALIALGALARALASIKALLLFTYKNPYVLVATGVVALTAYFAKLYFEAKRTRDLLSKPLDDSMGIQSQIDTQVAKLTELNKRLDDLKRRGPTVRMGVVDIAGFEANITSLQERIRQEAIITADLVKRKNDEMAQSFNDVSESISVVAPKKPIVDLILPDDAILEIKRRGQDILEIIDDLLDFEYSVPELLFPPGSLGFVKNELSAVKSALQGATDPDRIAEYTKRVDALTETIREWGRETQKLSPLTEATKSITDSFVNSFGAGMANIVVQGEKLQDVLKNIGKLLLSATIQKAISLLLTGGLSSAGMGFFGLGGGLLGNLFGRATSVNDAMITKTGKVIKFNPNDNILAMQDFGGLAGGKADMSKFDDLIDIARKTLNAIIPVNTTLKDIRGSVAGDKVVNVGAPSVTVNVPEGDPPEVIVNPPEVIVNPPEVIVRSPDVRVPDVFVYPPEITIPDFDYLRLLPDTLANFVGAVNNLSDNVIEMVTAPQLSRIDIPTSPQLLTVEVTGQLIGDGTTLYGVIKNVERSYR